MGILLEGFVCVNFREEIEILLTSGMGQSPEMHSRICILLFSYSGSTISGTILCGRDSLSGQLSHNAWICFQIDIEKRERALCKREFSTFVGKGQFCTASKP